MSTEADLLAADERARRDALDVTRSFIVQAPAGSGKTELLIQRYLRLLGTAGEPEEVLAITFTRKAALEMQLRVIDSLRDARDGVAAKTAHEQLTIDSASAVLARDREQGWGLLEAPGRLRIQTVDAFCAGVARSLPMCSGIGGLAVTAGEVEIPNLYREAAAATLDYLAGGDDVATSVERVLVHLDNNVGLYVGYLARMLASREQWLAITGSGKPAHGEASAVRQRLESNIADMIVRQLEALDANVPRRCREELPELLRYAATNLLAGGNGDHPLTLFADKSDFPRPELEYREYWRAMAGMLLTTSGEWRKRFTVNDGFPPQNAGPKAALAELLEAVADCDEFREGLHRTRILPEPRYPDEQWQVLLALLQLLPITVAELRRLFGERGVSDHNEVALAATNALGSVEEPGELALMLDYRIRHLLVDEMQDTSINQYELLRKLTAGWSAGDGRTIFCVGDPMQSIYRFRDAEVGEFLIARRDGIGAVPLAPLVLRRNFRSGGQLVHWFNTVFLQVMPLQDDVAVGAIAYTESVPVEARAGRGECSIHPLFAADAATEAGHTLGVIRQCLDSPVDESVAVLVRSRAQLRELLPLLRGASIPYQAIDIDRLTDLPEVIDLLAVTRALCHEGDRLAWLGLLRGPWVGLCWQDLHRLTVNDASGTLPELMEESQRLESLTDDGRQRVTQFLQVIGPYRQRRATMTLRDRVEAAWCALGGPALLTTPDQLENAYRYLDAIARLEVCGTVDDVLQIEAMLDAERVSSSSGPGCRLQIMTMHKAKGLQFDHVILHGLGRAARGDEREVLNWLTLPDARGRSEMIISPVGPRGELDNDPLHQFIESVEREKSRMEMDRLLYVACTRAKQTLHVIGSVNPDNTGSGPRAPDARSLLNRLWPALESEFAAALAAARIDGNGMTESAGGEDALQVPPLRRLRSGWHPARIPAAPVPVTAREVVAGEREVEFYWVGSSARYAGTLVHRWLQLLAEQGLDAAPDSQREQQALTRRWAREIGVAANLMDDVCSRTESALIAVLADEKGRWILAADGRSELPISGVIDGRVESVVIDRVVVDPGGDHWVIDYKTSSHEGGGVEGFLLQEETRYRPQLEKYALLYQTLTGCRPRIALYFPLLRQFRELAPAGG